MSAFRNLLRNRRNKCLVCKQPATHHYRTAPLCREHYVLVTRWHGVLRKEEART